MKTFILDENLPRKIKVTSGSTFLHVEEILSKGSTDTDLWNYAKEHGAIIVTKDADFAERILPVDPPPRVVHLKFGNMRIKQFHNHLALFWDKIEQMIETDKLVKVYLDRIEGVIALSKT
ncbi:MAG TPA: DUF5615 family PIN-like protein [Thermodesulfobacteriota bacterium]|nr:DUF5615 family PIN-like protein [Thermodesulfobacteriota bacterium]